METKHYVDEEGIYLGGFSEDTAGIPEGATEVETPPLNASYVWNGSVWIIPKSVLKEYTATYRYIKEVGGVTLSGLPLPTDDRAKMLINGAYNKAVLEANPTAVKHFKLPNGTFIPLTNADIIGIGAAIADHVQKCFDSEGAVYVLIDSDDITTLAEVESAFDTAYASQ